MKPITKSRRRKSSCISLLLTAACSSTLPSFIHGASAPRDSSPHVKSINQVSRFAKRDEPSSNIAIDTSPDERLSSDSIHSCQSTATDPSSFAAAAAAAAVSKKKSSLSLHASSGIVSILQKILLDSSQPLLRTATFAAQLAAAAYLTKVSWKVVKEAWDELNQEYGIHYRKEDDVREEQDMPFVDSKDVGSDLDQSSLNDDLRREGHRRENQTHQVTAVRDLANRLHSAGIPFASEMEDAEKNNLASQTVEGVIKSLTRSEGNVLSQTLLTPMDDGTFNQQDSQESAATKAWNAIGGLSQAKESLLDLAFPLLPSSSTESNNYYGGLLANPPGVLLYGPPGCGKSMLVRALANTVGARFLVVSPSCLLRKYVGETNLNVRALFSVAAKISPCVIFVDELDGLFRERGGEDHDVSRDLKTEFLQLWDGVRHNHLGVGAPSSSVLVIGATNRPFDVDPAFLRRMPRKIFIGLPDEEARASVVIKMLHGVPLDESFDVEMIAKQTRGYTPSDLKEILQSAALFPLREARAEAMSSRAEQGEGSMKIPLSIPPLRALRTDDVLKALRNTKPTHFSKNYERDLLEWRSGGVRGASYADENDGISVTDVTFSSEYYNSKAQDESDDSFDESESDDDDYDEL
ncbi:hypothetical protein ACHAWO_000676 [Cyclotella atomus]|uniref:AAA+ ATPase domain-containing protein n=1 Tax=Cyclotella atomus TaxID=382360 RepID=A0ABD3NCC2_9STRA